MTRERNIRLQIVFDEVELDVLDSWRFITGKPSRSSAMRELIRRGLQEDGFERVVRGPSHGDTVVH